MNLTIEQYTAQLKSRLNALSENFIPLFNAASEFRADLVVRIYNDSENTAGEKLLSHGPYSTKPIYLSPPYPRNIGTHIGKRGQTVKPSKTSKNVGAKKTEIKSAYFAGGWNEVKQQVGRPPMEYFGDLKEDIQSASQINLQGEEVTITLSREVNASKLESLQKKYGEVLAPNQEELDQMKETIRLETIRILNGQ